MHAGVQSTVFDEVEEWHGHQVVLRHLNRTLPYCSCYISYHDVTNSTFASVAHSAAVLRLQENFPEVLRFTVSLFPSEDDDVITSPYNSMLSLNELIEHADAVLPIENQALHDIVAKVDKQVSRSSGAGGAATVDLISKGTANSQYSLF